MTIKHVVALDHGNGWVKARGDKGMMQPKPSYIADKEKVGTSYNDKKQLALTDYESVAYKKERYVWGDDVKSISGAIPTYGQENRYKNKYFQLVSQFAISEALGKGKSFEDVLVITGCPSDEKGTKKEEDLIAALAGTHVINGKMINVVEVIVLPQPLGTVMSLYLNEEGYVSDESFESSTVGVIDVGTGTTDLDVIQELRRLDEYKSIPFGMMDVYKNIEKFLKHQGIGNVSIPKIEEGFSKGVYKESERSRKDFEDEKPKAIEDVFKQLESGINVEWKNLKRFDKLIVAGGGASTFRKHFDSFIMDDYLIPPNPQTTNVEGFYRYGKYVQAMKND